METEYLIAFFIFIFGLSIGSFLNCVIYRLENNKKITGRSFCPKCKNQLKWQDLFPIFSFLLLKGKCRHCKEKISFQYPLVELLSAVLFTMIFLKFWEVGILNMAVMFYIFSVLIIIFVYDLKHFLIPDKVLFPAIIILFIYRIFESANISIVANYILASTVASGFFLIIFLISKGQWMGFGDVKLAILMGLLLGLSDVLVALFLAFLLGSVISIFLMAMRKKNLKSEVPFAPFLIAGTIISVFYGNQIIQWYLNLFLI